MVEEYNLGVLRAKIKFDVSNKEMEKLQVFKNSARNIDPSVKKMEGLIKQIPIMGRFFNVAKSAIGPLGMTGAVVGGIILMARMLSSTGQVVTSLKDTFKSLRDSVDDVILASAMPAIKQNWLDPTVANLKELMTLTKGKDAGLTQGLLQAAALGGTFADISGARALSGTALGAVKTDQFVEQVVDDAKDDISFVHEALGRFFFKKLKEQQQIAEQDPSRVGGAFNPLNWDWMGIGQTLADGFLDRALPGFKRGPFPEMGSSFSMGIGQSQQQTQANYYNVNSLFVTKTPAPLNIQGSAFAALLP